MLKIQNETSIFLDGFATAIEGLPCQPPADLSDENNLLWCEGWKEGFPQFQPANKEASLPVGRPSIQLGDPQIAIPNPYTNFDAEEIAVTTLINASDPVYTANYGVSISAFSEIEKFPDPAKSIYLETYDSNIKSGKTDQESKLRALKNVQNAGFYKTKQGWTQLAPDVRNKVNVREAILQPDGTYCIEDVDVFYPNAVKGDVKPIDGKLIEYAINNTNNSIKSGAQQPAITIGHPTDEQKHLGVQLKSLGTAINWRLSPRGNGMVAADFVGVDPNAVRLMQKNALTGLSSGVEGAEPNVNAGLVSDANKSNIRFGHVALLGGTAQALSQLPKMEVFAADNTLCFAADPELVQQPSQKEIKMPVSAEHHNKLGDAHLALGAAHKAFAAGEPGSDQKLVQGKSMLYDAHCAYEAANTDMAAGAPTDTVTTGPKDTQNPISKGVEGAGSVANEKKSEVAGPQNTFGAVPGATPGSIQVPQAKPEPPVDTPNPPAIKATTDGPKPPESKPFEADKVVDKKDGPVGVGNMDKPAAGAATFSADDVSKLISKNEELAKLVNDLSSKLNGLTTATARKDFEAEVIELRKTHYLPEDKIITANFDAALVSPTPAVSIQNLRDMLKSMPTMPKGPSDVTVFESAAHTDPGQAIADGKQAVDNVIRVLGHNIDTGGYKIKA